MDDVVAKILKKSIEKRKEYVDKKCTNIKEECFAEGYAQAMQHIRVFVHELIEDEAHKKAALNIGVVVDTVFKTKI